MKNQTPAAPSFHPAPNNGCLGCFDAAFFADDEKRAPGFYTGLCRPHTCRPQVSAPKTQQ